MDLSLSKKGSDVKKLLEAWSIPVEFIANRVDYLTPQTLMDMLEKEDELDRVTAAHIFTTIGSLKILGNIEAATIILATIDQLREVNFSDDYEHVFPYHFLAKHEYAEASDNKLLNIENSEVFGEYDLILDMPFDTRHRLQEFIFDYLRNGGAEFIKLLTSISEIEFIAVDSMGNPLNSDD